MSPRNVLSNLTIDYFHNNIHEGINYLNHFYAYVTAGDSISCVLLTGASSVHYDFVTNSNGPILLSFYEDSVISATAGVVALINNNRQSSNVALCKVYSGCTVTTNNGTLLLEQFIVGTTGGGTGVNVVSAQGGKSEIKNEFILKKNSYYKLVIKNTAAAALIIDYDASIYEE